MKKLKIKILSDKKAKTTAGCGRNWTEVCGTKNS